MGWKYSGTPGNDTIVAQGGTVSPGVIAANVIETEALADLLEGGGGDDLLGGVDGPDLLIGGAGNDTLLGGSGNDNLDGGAGNDWLEGGAGDDTLLGGAGADTMVGGDGTGGPLQGFDFASFATSPLGLTVYLATFPGNVSNGDAAGDVLTGIRGLIGSGSGDILGASYAASWLRGGEGRDTLISGAANDTLDGGGGFDLVAYNGIYYAHAPGNPGVFASLATPGANTMEAAGDAYLSVEGLAGSAGDDTLVGDAGANALYGLDGNDLLEGGAGADTLDGGAHADTASYFDSGSAEVDLHSGLARDGYGFTDLLMAVENVNGSNAADALRGDAGANLLRGLGGDDRLVGRAGADSLEGGEGHDILADHTQEVAGPGGGLLAGAFAATDADLLLGGASQDWIYASGGGDTIDGGADIDGLVMDFTGQAATLSFAFSATGTWEVRLDGAVTATVGAVEVVAVNGGAAGDLMDATDAAFYAVLDGGEGNDLLRGGASGDVLIGSAGDDRLIGSAGDDHLVGGAGHDTMAGGAGADTFRWDVAAEGGDVVQGFVSGEDRLWIDASGFGGGLSEGADLAATGQFVAGTAASAAQGQLLYDQATGVLLWDGDGTGAAAAETVATLDPGAVLLTSDFVVVA